MNIENPVTVIGYKAFTPFRLPSKGDHFAGNQAAGQRDDFQW
jgi:hypothetical protein